MNFPHKILKFLVIALAFTEELQNLTQEINPQLPPKPCDY